MEPLNFIGTQPFETKRLKLRAYKLSDAQYIYRNWASSDNVTKYLTWNTHDSLETSTKFCVERTKLSGRTDNFEWIIVDSELGEPVGSIGVVLADTEKREAHVGYVLGEKWWNKGYMTEAFEAVLAYLVFVVGFETVIAEHSTENKASGRVMEKCGLKKVGTSTATLEQKGGVQVETQVYKITKPEWYARNIRV
ncbi:GNAT family N-acetyltransferase [Ruminococcus sp.]|uniref:GNAT family N-acetyltransferase n=1 Tax=Ruminococcus sp. TaxID=41978 RepID=UPI0025FF2DAB|nr:GNAT family N-acetyltransferase [Ruminococcus sp.]MBQ8965179.1 GNAT family N-acetyltransferase [Ruminococcus sp.]